MARIRSWGVESEANCSFVFASSGWLTSSSGLVAGESVSPGHVAGSEGWAGHPSWLGLFLVDPAQSLDVVRADPGQ